MAPFALHGLNVVQPVHHDQDVPAPPDFSAHLDLWTNLAFESDEPLSQIPKRKLAEDTEDTAQDNHENTPDAPQTAPPLDISALLAGVGIDSLLMPTAPPAPVQHNSQQVQPAPSLAQLLALHAAYSSAYAVPQPPSETAVPSSSSTPPSNPPTKRTRTQKLSPPADNSPISAPQSPAESSQFDPNATPLSAAEDKRRRNTAASARFRLKKKEREAALERRAKELEERAVELERECEALRRENGWLKGLVVGVTGAGAAQHQQASVK